MSLESFDTHFLKFLELLVVPIRKRGQREEGRNIGLLLCRREIVHAELFLLLVGGYDPLHDFWKPPLLFVPTPKVVLFAYLLKHIPQSNVLRPVAQDLGLTLLVVVDFVEAVLLILKVLF